MATIGAVREALAAAVEVSGLSCSPYLRDTIDAPCAMVDRRQMDPRMVFTQGFNAYQFAVICFFPRSDEIRGQELMDDACEISGEASVLAAIQDENNWPDGLVHYASVVSIGDTVLRQGGDIEYLSVEFLVEVVW